MVQGPPGYARGRLSDYHPLMSSIDATLAMFHELDRTQQETWDLLSQPDTSMFAGARKRATLDAFFPNGQAGDYVPVPTPPPRGDKEEWIAKYKNRVIHPRVIYAAQAGSRGSEDVVVVYTNKLDSKSKDLWIRLTVADRDGEPKVVGQETRCSSCHGAGCGDCGKKGWLHVGTKMKPLKVTETRRLIEPEDRQSKIAYEALA